MAVFLFPEMGNGVEMRENSYILNKNKFKVGQTVRIRRDAQFKCDYGFNASMKRMIGKKMKISEIDIDSNEHMTIKLEGFRWSWSPLCFECCSCGIIRNE